MWKIQVVLNDNGKLHGGDFETKKDAMYSSERSMKHTHINIDNKFIPITSIKYIEVIESK